MAEFKGKQGHWVTTESGSKLFIESGGSFEEAVEQAFGKENAKKYKKYEDNSDKSELIQQVVEEMTNGGTKEVNLNAGTIARASGGKLTEEEVHQWFEDNDELEDYEAFDDDYEEEFEDSQRANIFDTDEEYKESIKPKIAKRYEEYRKEGLTQERIKEELYDEFGYQDLIDDVIKEGSVSDEFDNDFEIEDDDWSKWATKTDKSVPENWTPNGWDGDTRFYKVSNQNGVESVSTSPDGYTRVYTTEGSITFDSLEEAQKFMNAPTKEEATDIAWDRGWLGEGEEQAINDIFGSDNDFDNDLEAAFKRHGADEDAILDELRASGKDYGMSNGDLQAVVEAYVLNHEFDDDDETWQEEGYESKEHQEQNQKAIQNITNAMEKQEEEIRKLNKSFNNKEISLEDWIKKHEELRKKYGKLFREQNKLIK